jgi:hypothetical protein
MKSLSAHRCGFAARFIDGQEPILKLDLSTPASPPELVALKFRIVLIFRRYVAPGAEAGVDGVKFHIR